MKAPLTCLQVDVQVDLDSVAYEHQPLVVDLEQDAAQRSVCLLLLKKGKRKNSAGSDDTASMINYSHQATCTTGH